LTVVVAVVAAIGQKLYAEDENFVNQIGILGFDLTPWFAPFVFDLAVAALLHGGINAARDRLSPWPWWAGAGIVAALSVYTNTQHIGAQITASASAGLFLIWGLHLYNKYRKIVRARQVEDATAEWFLPTDVLFAVDRKWANRALVITQTKPLDQAVAYRHALGETKLTPRTAAILAAQTYIDIFDDELYALLNPHLAAKPVKPDGTPDDDAPVEKKVRLWQLGRRSRARRLATMTASDTVDRWLGLPVPDRRGIVPSRVTYSAPDPIPVFGAGAAKAALPAAPPAAPVDADAVRPPAVQSPPRRRAIAAGAGGQPPRHAAEPVSGAPKGTAGANWVPLEKLEGLPYIDPGKVCECSPDPAKFCGRTLAYHVQRRGRYVQQIITAMPDWSMRTERIGKGVVRDICQVSSDIQQDVGWVFDQLLALAHQQRKAQAATAVIDGDPADEH
jgi:hypothetical protein